MVSKFIKRGKTKENVWEHGNTGQFWKGTRTPYPPSLGRPSYSFFSIKANRCVFELSVPCVYLFHCVIATEFDYGITTGSEYCMQLIV